jgi:steroid 5-alpha reductase family enzyme
MLETVLVCTLVCCLIMVFVWFWAKAIKNAGVVDIFWSFNFAFVAIIVCLMATGYWERKLLICTMILIWSMRLGIYLLIRVGSHLQVEEGRYKKLREEWVPNPDRRFFWFFQMQAISNIYLSIPFFLIAFNTKPQLSKLEYIGVAIWAVSILGEGIADGQLKKFKSDPANKGKVCDAGLWNYSRHPNYFFESMIWVGYFCVALNADYGWLGILSPITILLLLFRVTGIPMTEEQAIRSKGDLYKEYQRTTSVFVPWVKKK